jgi:hypothetical protein
MAKRQEAGKEILHKVWNNIPKKNAKQYLEVGDKVKDYFDKVSSKLLPNT